jgi:hypothetical protein
MPSIPSPARRVKPARFARLSPVLPSGKRVLTLYVGVTSFRYYLTPVPGAPGAYRLEKFAVDGGGSYDVDLTAPSCECKGFLRWGHCKHVDSLSALRASGRLA